MNKIFSSSKQIGLFEGIAPADLENLLACLTAVKRQYEKDEFIFLAGSPARLVGIILSGGVHVLREDFMGNRAILAALGEGELFGEAFACARVQRLPVSVVATQPCEILLIDYRKIITTCPSTCVFHKRLIENMLVIIAKKNVALNQKADILSKRTTREKLIAYLSDQAQRAGERKFLIPFNRQELADYLSVDRSAMSAELSKMRKDGLVRTQRNAFELLDTSFEE